MELNTIHNEDCLETMKRMADKSVDLVLTDPPYGIDYQSNMRVMSKKFDKLVNDNNDSRFLAYAEFYRLLKDNCVAIVFCSFKNYADDYNELKKYFNIKNCIIWSKGGGGIGDLSHSLLTDYEMAIVAHKGMAKIRGKRYGSVWNSSKVDPNKMFHPTEKPVDLISKMVESFSDEGNIVLDPYLGGGSTALACRMLKRNYIGIEISSEYCKIAQDRIKSISNPLF